MALRLFDEAIELDPTCGEAHLRKGILQLEYDRDPPAAILSLQRAVELMPDSAEARYQLGSAQLAAGELEAAGRSIDAAIAKLPPEIYALFNCAGVPHPPFPAVDVMLINFVGLRHLTEALLPRIADGGAIASIASTAGMAWKTNLERVRAFLAVKRSVIHTVAVAPDVTMRSALI